MYRSSFGKQGQISFSNENEYYELLGYLAKSDRTTALTWEHNEDQGAWGSEGRIKFFTSNIPVSASLNHTAGVSNIVSRVNCNDFIENIATNHNFIMGRNQNLNNIRNTIPLEFQQDFDRGLNL